jgi:hypothetical protein
MSYFPSDSEICSLSAISEVSFSDFANSASFLKRCAFFVKDEKDAKDRASGTKHFSGQRSGMIDRSEMKISPQTRRELDLAAAAAFPIMRTFVNNNARTCLTNCAIRAKNHLVQ